MNYYSCGKLLITAEYLILKGAKGLAIPTKYGQKMSVAKNTEKHIVWEAYSFDNEKWIDCKFDLNFKLIKSKNTKTEYTHSLSKLLKEINEFSPGFAGQGLKISTNLEFHRMLYLRAQAPAMLAIAETVWLQLGPTMRSLYDKLNRKEPPHTHTAIIAALTAGDEPGLRLAVRSDVTHGLRHLLK